MSYDILLAILKGVAMPNMQMNFRIDAELKRRGDERFARFGCTPSEAMRRLYEVAARYDDESEAALQAVIGPETEEADAMSEGEKRARAIASGATRGPRYSTSCLASGVLG